MSKVSNKFYNRYFVSNSAPLSRVADDYSFSNMMYDKSKGVTHCLLPYCTDGSKPTRFVGDVELCMSNDPNIVSRFSAEHRDMLRKQLASQPHSPATNSPSPTDDQLMQNGAIRSLERDEIVAGAKHNLSRLDAELPRVSAPSASPTPPATSAPTVEPPKSE